VILSHGGKWEVATASASLSTAPIVTMPMFARAVRCGERGGNDTCGGFLAHSGRRALCNDFAESRKLPLDAGLRARARCCSERSEVL
jgi:hypothetical protein